MVDRRSFLNPGRLLKQVTNLQQELQSSLSKLESLGAVPVVTMQREAMACQFEIQFGEPKPARTDGLAALDLIEELEQQLTVYRDDSEVSRLNSRAPLQPVVVEEKLFELLTLCKRLGKETDGAFDITAGPLVRMWGFKRRQGRFPDEEEIRRVLQTVGMDYMHLDPTQWTVKFAQPGMEINLGGIGKGYALDRAGQQFPGLRNALLSAGHSSLLAKGKPYWDSHWQIDVLHPLEPGMRVATVRLKDRGFSTSGVSEQFFWHQGRRYSHLIDPRTGWPVQGVLQVSVVAANASVAEVLSTAFFVNGLQWTENFCKKHPNVGVLFIPDPGPDQNIQVYKLGKINAAIDITKRG